MNNSQRAWNWTKVVVSAVVLALCVIGIVGTWIVNQAVTAAVVDLLSGVEKTAGILQESLAGLGSKVGGL